MLFFRFLNMAVEVLKAVFCLRPLAHANCALKKLINSEFLPFTTLTPIQELQLITLFMEERKIQKWFYSLERLDAHSTDCTTPFCLTKMS